MSTGTAWGVGKELQNKLVSNAEKSKLAFTRSPFQPNPSPLSLGQPITGPPSSTVQFVGWNATSDQVDHLHLIICWFYRRCSACTDSTGASQGCGDGGDNPATPSLEVRLNKLSPAGLFSFALLNCVGEALLLIRQPCFRLLLSVAARTPLQQYSSMGRTPRQNH